MPRIEILRWIKLNKSRRNRSAFFRRLASSTMLLLSNRTAASSRHLCGWSARRPIHYLILDLRIVIDTNNRRIWAVESVLLISRRVKYLIKWLVRCNKIKASSTKTYRKFFKYSKSISKIKKSWQESKCKLITLINN